MSMQRCSPQHHACWGPTGASLCQAAADFSWLVAADAFAQGGWNNCLNELGTMWQGVQWLQHAEQCWVCFQFPSLTGCFPCGCAVSLPRYTHLLRLVESTRDFEEQEQVEHADTLKVALTSNLALTAFHQEEYMRCIEWCDKTLQADPNNAKVRRTSKDARCAGCWVLRTLDKRPGPC